MGNYKINSISKIDYKSYKDVVLIAATKERGFWASLFFSDNEEKFVVSTDSPLYQDAKTANTSEDLWSIDEDDFHTEKNVVGFVLVEDGLENYEIARLKRIKEAEEKERRKKEREEEERRLQERKRKEEEERKLQDFFANATIHELDISGLQMVVDENADFSTQMSAIAGNANLCFTTGNKKGMLNNLVSLYNKVHGYNSHKLKTISPDDGQIIGLAFVKMAMFFDNGDLQVNEIAAQNAYYSIAKNYFGTQNTCALPALFTLLYEKPRTLEDELYAVEPDSRLVGLGGMMLSAQYIRIEKAMKNRLPIMKFLLDKFYDVQKKKYKIDSTLPYHIPSVKAIEAFLREYKQSGFSSKSKDLGATYFKEVYENIEEQLNL